ncbi:MAG: phosphate uptake regulator PhoU [Promethearchaeota archaeon]|nr:MAG: phosphate uptake regulator PhoU [Candidatus Lokiarchaeota archaeon]
MFHIETRKIQKTGGSSYIVSLPIDWIKSHNIDKKYKGYSLGLISQPDGNLLITPNPNSEEILKAKEINVDDIQDYNFLFRILIGAYIMGYSRIIIKASKKFETFVRDCVNNFTQVAIGPEIIEESNQVIIIKDLLNPKEMPFEKTIRRMYILAESMHEDAIEALKTKNIDLAEEVTKRDDEIDRLHWLIGRQSHIVLKDIILCQKMGVTLEDANQYQFFSKFLERIGDHAVKIAKNVLNIIEQDIDENLINDISKASKISLNLLTNSLDAWLQKNIHLANYNIESVNELIKICEALPSHTKNYTTESSIAISYIVESIRRTGEYASDISEIIINSLIGAD